MNTADLDGAERLTLAELAEVCSPMCMLATDPRGRECRCGDRYHGIARDLEIVLPPPASWEWWVEGGSAPNVLARTFPEVRSPESFNQYYRHRRDCFAVVSRVRRGWQAIFECPDVCTWEPDDADLLGKFTTALMVAGRARYATRGPWLQAGPFRSIDEARRVLEIAAELWMGNRDGVAMALRRLGAVEVGAP